MSSKTITLLNGNTLECAVGKPFVGKTDAEIHKESYQTFHIFKHFAHFLLENADRIMSDSKMFLCPIYSQVFSPWCTESRPRLGTFIEWWIRCSDISCDKFGNPIYQITGNPLTGSHACYTIDENGNSGIDRNKGFLSILQSFSKVNKRYPDVKADGEHYEFDEVLKILSGDTYDLRMKAVKYKIELDETTQNLKRCREWNSEISKKLGNVITANRRMIISGIRDKILDFYLQYSAKEKAYLDECIAHSKFKQEKKPLLHSGQISLEEYENMMKEASKPKRELQKELSDMGVSFMYEHFNPNPNEINLKMILDYAKHQINGY